MRKDQYSYIHSYKKGLEGKCEMWTLSREPKLLRADLTRNFYLFLCLIIFLFIIIYLYIHQIQLQT